MRCRAYSGSPISPAPWIAALLLTTLAPAAVAQVLAYPGHDNPWMDHADGPVIVWVSVCQPSGPLLVEGVPQLTPGTPMVYKEQTAGSFGQSASDFGTASSNVGQSTITPSIAAQPPRTGFPEQTAGSFGRTAGSVGTPSSNYGHDAGTFGQSLDTVAAAGETQGTALRHAAPSLPEAARLLRDDPMSAYLHAEYTAVECSTLRDRLLGTRGTAAYPDLLLGALPPGWDQDRAPSFSATMALPASWIEDGVTPSPRTAAPHIVLLRDAPHRPAARAFLVWLSERGGGAGCPGCILDPRTEDRHGEMAAARAASAAVLTLLSGGSLGVMADPAMASFPARLGIGMGVVEIRDGQWQPVPDTATRVEVQRSSSFGPLAIVALRAVTLSDTAFGIAHPLLVMRRGSDAQWRVLHISLNLVSAEQGREAADLVALGRSHSSLTAGLARGVSLASPPDGDSRSPQPELWWDNAGGAALQVVEYQQQLAPGAWSDTHLFLVPDDAVRTRTRVVASFAQAAATYRWRVWSMGGGDDMVITPWRTLNILPR
jgi:hypothetical protein